MSREVKWRWKESRMEENEYMCGGNRKKEEWWGLQRKTMHMVAHGRMDPLPKTLDNNNNLNQ